MLLLIGVQNDIICRYADSLQVLIQRERSLLLLGCASYCYDRDLLCLSDESLVVDRLSEEVGEEVEAHKTH